MCLVCVTSIDLPKLAQWNHILYQRAPAHLLAKGTLTKGFSSAAADAGADADGVTVGAQALVRTQPAALDAPLETGGTQAAVVARGGGE